MWSASRDPAGRRQSRPWQSHERPFNAPASDASPLFRRVVPAPPMTHRASEVDLLCRKNNTLSIIMNAIGWQRANEVRTPESVRHQARLSGSIGPAHVVGRRPAPRRTPSLESAPKKDSAHERHPHRSDRALPGSGRAPAPADLLARAPARHLGGRAGAGRALRHLAHAAARGAEGAGLRGPGDAQATARLLRDRDLRARPRRGVQRDVDARGRVRARCRPRARARTTSPACARSTPAWRRPPPSPTSTASSRPTRPSTSPSRRSRTTAGCCT